MIDIEVVKSTLAIVAFVAGPAWLVYSYKRVGKKRKGKQPVKEVKTGGTRYTKVRNNQGRRETYDSQMNRWVYLDLLSEDELGFEESISLLLDSSLRDNLQMQSSSYSSDDVVQSSSGSCYDSAPSSPSGSSYGGSSYSSDSSSSYSSDSGGSSGGTSSCD